MRLRPRRSGFTLVELLMVIVIIGILAAVAMSRYWSARDQGLRAGVINDLRSLATLQEAYYGQHMTYAASAADLPDFQTTQGVSVTITAADAQGFAATGTHASLGSLTCGLFVGGASAASAAPATSPGVIACQ